ncbi:DUF4395 domain-containing protein [Niallia sp. Krafla_26]|uniref:DUF4395 domain-containing protein n=1 Tax=Niallia sp. Krafla_26 TaxID=3064703 RepID=UPI003D1731C3
MTETIRSIPRPLIKTNQSVIVISVLLSWMTQNEFILLIPLVAGLSGLLFGYNPIMQFAKRFLKKPMNSYVPEDWEQQQFNQKIAVFCLAAGFLSFLLGWTVAGYIFTIMVATAASIAILGFCIGCFILFQWKQFQYRRSQQ